MPQALIKIKWENLSPIPKIDIFGIKEIASTIILYKVVLMTRCSEHHLGKIKQTIPYANSLLNSRQRHAHQVTAVLTLTEP